MSRLEDALKCIKKDLEDADITDVLYFSMNKKGEITKIAYHGMPLQISIVETVGPYIAEAIQALKMLTEKGVTK